MKPRLVLATVMLLSAAGVLAWQTMPREEDPRLPDRFGLVLAQYPGADAEQVERLVVERLEDALAEVDAIKVVKSTARADIAVFNVELRDDITEPTPEWDEVRRVLAAVPLPDGAGPVIVDDAQMDKTGIIVAVTGTLDPIALSDAADRVEDGLLAMPNVARIERAGDAGEQITVAIDDAAARRVGLSAGAIAGQLSSRYGSTPGGVLAVDDRSLALRTEGALRDLDEIRAAPVLLASGAAVPLSALASVERWPAHPIGERARLQGKPAVMLGIVPRQAIDAPRFGAAVQLRIAELAEQIAPLNLEVVTFQPARVSARLDGLAKSLLLGICIVALLLIVSMGPRLGLVVAVIVPLVALASVGIYGMAGGVLHQMSISALVIALGLLVDNAIVMTESVQRRIDDGEAAWAAAKASVKELALPLAAATGTTLASFVPMLLSEGPTGDFTRALPVVIMLTLTVSYGFAIGVTPVLSARFLRPRKSAAEGVVARALGGFAVRRRRWVLVGAVGLVAGAVLLAGGLQQRFFPSADRNQFVVDVKLPEGAHLDAVDAAARSAERMLQARGEVTSVAAFMGRGTLPFYYNLPRLPQVRHLAQLVVTTRTPSDVPQVAKLLGEWAGENLPQADIISRPLEQGPPILAPVEIRLAGDDLPALALASESVRRALRGIPQARSVRSDLGQGVPRLRLEVDDAAADRLQLSRAQVAQAVVGRTRGLPAGVFEAGDDPIPIVVRDRAGDAFPLAGLDGIDVGGRQAVPLGQVARGTLEWRPAALHHRDRERVVTVTAQLAPGAAFSAVSRPLRDALDALTLPAGVRWSFGGEAEGAGQANSSLTRALPIGMFLLLFILLAEFNSFRRLGIILVTVPLAVTGVVPGLLIGGQPFGFMSLLGVFALIGIVVNNAIVLLDRADRGLVEGASPSAAVVEAVQVRMRPVLLTTATTVLGLVPLAVSPTTLWPPLAWSMISGLLASTVLTLLVVPALYVTLIRQEVAA